MSIDADVRYSIVVPVYRSGPWLAELATRVGAAMARYQARFELILVNDASPDTVTWREIEVLSERYPWVRGIDLLYNAGQFKATLCGLQHSRGKYVLTMDDDLQHPPEELPKLIDAIESDPSVECVFGRYEVKQHSLVRNLGSRGMHQVLNRLYGKPRDVDTTSFRVMKRSLVETLLAYRIAHPMLGPMIVTVTKKVKNVPVRHDSRPYGGSNYGLWRLVRFTFRSIIDASIAPLRMVSIVGFTCAVASFLVAAFYLIRKLTGGIDVPGFTTLVLAISFFGGTTLLGIGILGEYVGRIISEITGPPRYMIRSATNACPDRDAVSQ